MFSFVSITSRWFGLALLVNLLTLSPLVHAEVPSFEGDVIPVLTRFGCNSGGCHGKLAGQNGFKLSLRGYAPEMDHEAISRDAIGRRVNSSEPARSLLLQKATNAMPHGGGQRLTMDSPAVRVLIDWIIGGMPGVSDSQPKLVRLELSPGQQTLVIGQAVKMQVTALDDKGLRRDVTWLTQFSTRDPVMLEISESGHVRALRHGETVVTAAYRGLIEVATMTVQYENTIQPEWYTARNNPIDDAVFEKLAQLRIEPSPLCDDAAFLRRVSLDLLGVLPSAEEVRQFVNDPDADKRQRLVDALLERPEFVDYWTYWLSELLQNRKERDHDVRGVKGVRRFHEWLHSQVAAGRSWKEIATSVLTSKGSCFEQPGVGYFIVTVGEKEAHESEVADSVAQSFLGTRIGCARCHNHPLEKSTQDDYYRFVGFFSRLTLDRQRPEESPTVLQVGTRNQFNLRRQIRQEQTKLEQLKSTNPDPKQISDMEKRIAEWEKQFLQDGQSLVQVRQPRTGQMLAPRPLDRSELTIPTGGDPRDVFVTWMTDPTNPYFSGAMVNRLWKHFLGHGLVEPVDDLRATNPPSNRSLWNLLNQEFVQNGFQLKPVMRLIVNSRTYQLASSTRDSNIRDRHFHSHFLARRLPAEVLLDAICSATVQPDTFPGYAMGMRAVQIPDPFTDSYFLTLFGRSPRTTACACERSGDVTLPQLLHLQNGDALYEKIRAGDGRLAQLLSSQSSDSAVVEELYLNTLSRLPTDHERTEILASLKGDDRSDALADLFWALLNSKDFTFNR